MACFSPRRCVGHLVWPIWFGVAPLLDTFVTSIQRLRPPVEPEKRTDHRVVEQRVERGGQASPAKSYMFTDICKDLNCSILMYEMSASEDKLDIEPAHYMVEAHRVALGLYPGFVNLKHLRNVDWGVAFNLLRQRLDSRYSRFDRCAKLVNIEIYLVALSNDLDWQQRSANFGVSVMGSEGW